MDTALRDKVIVVTGASGGIGSGIARAFAAEGAQVVLHYHRGKKRAEQLRKELGAPREALVGADLRLESGARRLLGNAVKSFGRVDTLVANAGAWEAADIPMQRMTARQWRRTMDGILNSTFLVLREFLRIVERQKRGNAVLIGSTAAVFGEAGHADYSAGKAAVAFGLTRSLKNELTKLAPHTADYCGGRINCICPGWTVVPRLQKKLGDTATIRKVTATMALPQLARPEDIGNAAVFLASDALARHITGQTLIIAGGMEGRLLWQPGEINPAIV